MSSRKAFPGCFSWGRRPARQRPRNADWLPPAAALPAGPGAHWPSELNEAAPGPLAPPQLVPAAPREQAQAPAGLPALLSRWGFPEITGRPPALRAGRPALPRPRAGVGPRGRRSCAGRGRRHTVSRAGRPCSLQTEVSLAARQNPTGSAAAHTNQGPQTPEPPPRAPLRERLRGPPRKGFGAEHVRAAVGPCHCDTAAPLGFLPPGSRKPPDRAASGRPARGPAAPDLRPPPTRRTRRERVRFKPARSLPPSLLRSPEQARPNKRLTKAAEPHLRRGLAAPPHAQPRGLGPSARGKVGGAGAKPPRAAPPAADVT